MAKIIERSTSSVTYSLTLGPLQTLMVFGAVLAVCMFLAAMYGAEQARAEQRAAVERCETQYGVECDALVLPDFASMEAQDNG